MTKLYKQIILSDTPNVNKKYYPSYKPLSTHMAITCKTCKKFAKLESVLVNGMDEVKLIGSCKHCGYENLPRTVDENGRKLFFTEIGINQIDYDDWEELGIDR